MKKYVAYVIGALSVLALLAVSCTAPAPTAAPEVKQPRPTMTVSAPVAALSKTTQLVIMGSGFEPGKELQLFLTTTEPLLKNDIGLNLNPKPVPSTTGTWITTFTLGDFASVVKRDVYSITATDAGYSPLASTCFALYDPKEAPDKAPAWAKPFLPPPPPATK